MEKLLPGKPVSSLLSYRLLGDTPLCRMGLPARLFLPPNPRKRNCHKHTPLRLRFRRQFWMGAVFPLPSLEIVFLMLISQCSSCFAPSEALEPAFSKRHRPRSTCYCRGSTSISFITSFIHFLWICFQRTVTCHSSPPSIPLAKSQDGGEWPASTMGSPTLSKWEHVSLSTIHPSLQSCLGETKWRWTWEELIKTWSPR